MAQGETADYDLTWDYDGTSVDYRETSERQIGIPKFLSSPTFNKTEKCIRWKISGRRPLTVYVYRRGKEIDSFTHEKKGSVLKLTYNSRWKCGEYGIKVTNRHGEAMQHVDIKREHLN